MNIPHFSDRIRSIEQLLQSTWGRLAADPKALADLPDKVTNFIKRMGLKGDIANRANQLVGLLTANMKTDASGSMLNARNAVIIGAALLYLLSPFDFIPDLVPVVGWMDDLSVLALALNFIFSSCSGSFKKEEGDPSLAKEK